MIKNIFFYIFLGVSLCSVAQRDSPQFLDKEFYLVDSLPFNRVSEVDFALLDTTLRKYHTQQDDTSKIKLLEHIIEQSWNIEIWPRYNLFFKRMVEEQLKKDFSPALKYWYTSKLAQSINNIGFFHNSHGEMDKAIHFYRVGLEMQLAIGDSASSGATFNNIGGAYMYTGQLDSAMHYYVMAKEIYEKLNKEEQLVHPLLNIAYLYNLQGNVQLALDYYTESLKYAQESDNFQGMTSALLNLGVIYKNQKDFDKAIEYLKKGVEVGNKIGYKEGVSAAINNLGGVFDELGDKKKSEEYYRNAALLFKEIEDWQGYASATTNIGNIVMRRDKEEGLKFLLEALDMYNKIDFHEGQVSISTRLGNFYLKEGDVAKGKEYGLKSLQMAQELGYPDLIQSAAQLLQLVYDEEGNSPEAYKMYKLHIQMRDSIFNLETQKATIKQEAKYQYDRQKIIDEVEHQKQLAIKEQEQEKQRFVIYMIIFGLILVIAFLIFVYNRLQVTRKQKQIIEEQKEEVEAQRDEIEEQKEKVEEVHKEIQDSIIYAKRIQKAILPADSFIHSHLPNAFVLYKPKDVVAGDFYWMEKVGDTLLFAVADCTGHGVPGAMVSVVCHNAINRAVREFKITDPGLILDKTREIVVEELSKSNEEVKDGMDIALCSLTPEKRSGASEVESWKLKYAGANNPLWVFRQSDTHGQNGVELIEIKADKLPIGKTEINANFTTHQLELQTGDTIYLFSDGYIDQFGGAEGKKFGSKRLRDLVLTMQDEHMNGQYRTLQETLSHWIGEGAEEQIDDICIMGIKV